MSTKAYRRLLQEWNPGRSGILLPSQQAINIPGLIEDIMTAVRETCGSLKKMHLNIDLGEFYSSLVNEVRSIRHGTFQQLGKQIMDCVLSSLHDIREQSVQERNQRLQELETEMWEFHETWAACGRTLSPATKEDARYARLWAQLGEPTGQSEWAENARFSVNIEANLIMEEEHIASGKRESLTMDWLADTLASALTARICCRSIASGHTSSFCESVGVAVAA